MQNATFAASVSSAEASLPEISSVPLVVPSLSVPARLAVDIASNDGVAAPILPVKRPSYQFDPAMPPILVADDDDDDRFFVDRLIRKTGIKNPVRTFDDGSEVVNFLASVRRGCAELKHRPPLLLFLDLNMHGLGGFGFLEWARSQKELAPLTIVVLSNSDHPEDMRRSLELGAHRYLVKYPSVQTFASIVRSVYPLTVF